GPGRARTDPTGGSFRAGQRARLAVVSERPGQPPYYNVQDLERGPDRRPGHRLCGRDLADRAGQRGGPERQLLRRRAVAAGAAGGRGYPPRRTGTPVFLAHGGGGLPLLILFVTGQDSLATHVIVLTRLRYDPATRAYA